MGSSVSTGIRVVGAMAFLILGIAQLVAGFAGIDHSVGVLWACVALIAALVFRFTLPITIGAFFGAMNVWGWHWALSAIFAAPGLLLVVPGAISQAFDALRSKTNRKKLEAPRAIAPHLNHGFKPLPQTTSGRIRFSRFLLTVTLGILAGTLVNTYGFPDGVSVSAKSIASENDFQEWANREIRRTSPTFGSALNENTRLDSVQMRPDSNLLIRYSMIKVSRWQVSSLGQKRLSEFADIEARNFCVVSAKELSKSGSVTFAYVDKFGLPLTKITVRRSTCRSGSHFPEFAPGMFAKHEVTNRLESCLSASTSGTGDVACANRSRQEWDLVMNRVYQDLRKGLNYAQKLALRDRQRQWLKDRDEAFRALDRSYEKDGGTLQLTLHAAKKAEFVEARARTLGDQLEALSNRSRQSKIPEGRST